MEYTLTQTETAGMWNIRVYKGHALCGKLRVDTTTKDELVTKFGELGWTERT